MANKTIPQLPEQTGKTNDDLLVIVDSGETLTSKIKVSTLLSGTGNLVEATGTTSFKTSNITDDTKVRGNQAFYIGHDIINNNGITSSGDRNIVIGAGRIESGSNNSILNSSTETNTAVCNGNSSYGNVVVGAGQLSSSSFWGAGMFKSTFGELTNCDRSIVMGGRFNKVSGSASLNACGGVNSLVSGGGSGIYCSDGVVSGNNSAKFHTVGSNGITGNNSGILFGTSHGTLSTDYSVIIGGSGLTSTYNEEVLVPNLTIANYASLNYADDTAAAAGGIVLGQVYHNNGALRIRIT